MSVLAPDALAGLSVAAAPAGAAAGLAAALTAWGASAATDGGPVDLVLVAVEAPGSLEQIADGQLATGLVAAFAEARRAAEGLRAGGCLLFVLAGAAEAPTAVALAALTRTLALEWAPAQRRVNAIVCAQADEVAELAALVAAAPSRVLTGAIIDARRATTGVAGRSRPATW